MTFAKWFRWLASLTRCCTLARVLRESESNYATDIKFLWLFFVDAGWLPSCLRSIAADQERSISSGENDPGCRSMFGNGIFFLCSGSGKNSAACDGPLADGRKPAAAHR